MRVFISWSGERSKHIAEGLRAFLPDVIQSLRPFMSQADIEAGARWSSELKEQLDASSFGVVVLTPENITSPWLLFECGALGKSLEHSRVCPLLYSLTTSEVQWPLAQFQCNSCDKAGLQKIVNAINAASPADQKLGEDYLVRSYDRCWPDMQRILGNVPTPDEPISRPDRPVSDVLEEILTLLRSRTYDKISCEQLSVGMNADIGNALNVHGSALLGGNLKIGGSVDSGIVRGMLELIARQEALEQPQSDGKN